MKRLIVPWYASTICPECNEELEHDEDGYYCTNKDCNGYDDDLRTKLKS